MRNVRVQKFLRRSAFGAAVLGVTLPVLAQEAGSATTQPSGQWWQSGQQQQRTERWTEGGTAPSGTEQQRMGGQYGQSGQYGQFGQPGQPGQTGQAGQMGERPREGWVRIGIDFGNGRFERFEYVPAAEAERLNQYNAHYRRGLSAAQAWREQSQQFRGEGFARGERGQFQQGREFEREEQTTWREGGRGLGARLRQRLQGRITDISTMDVENEQHTVAWIETDDNRRIQVDLGPRDNLSERLGRIRSGERLFVSARPTRVHGRSLWVADRVEYNGQVFTPTWSERFARLTGQNNQEYTGEILSTRQAQYVGFDDAHLLARVRLDDGSVALIDLGPARDVSNLNFRRGDQIVVMARPACINDRDALIAAEVSTPSGQFVQLDNYAPGMSPRLRGRPVGPGELDQGRRPHEDRPGTFQRSYRERSRTFQQQEQDTSGRGSQYYEPGTTTRPSGTDEMGQQNTDDQDEGSDTWTPEEAD
jgi:hypothetical protein